MSESEAVPVPDVPAGAEPALIGAAVPRSFGVDERPFERGVADFSLAGVPAEASLACHGRLGLNSMGGFIPR